jgi:hypothetical protein
MACSTTRRAMTVKSCSVPFDFVLLERLGIAPLSETGRSARMLHE